MRYLWQAWLPLLFLPNLGFGGPTGFGTLELSDFLIGPFLILTAMAARRAGPALIGRLTPLLSGFAGWALLATVLIRERYGYTDHIAVFTGVLKLGRLALYGTAAVLAARALGDEAQRRRFPWALAASGLVVAVALFQAPDPRQVLLPGELTSGYKAANAVSVMMAVLLCYLGGLWECRLGTPRWRSVAGPALVVMILGFFLSHGRGGWVAALAGVVYVVFRRGLGPRILIGSAGVVVVTLAAYSMLPDFRSEVDQTIWPDQDAQQWYKSGVGGFDDGARLSTWTHEVAALGRSPLLGTGFFHRGATAGLWLTGSHNFFLQMFLETGLVGGILLLAIFLRMWRLAGTAPARAAGQDVPVRAALVAALVGGLSGEYFYGGMVVFTLLLVFAPVGALSIEAGRDRPGSSRFAWTYPGNEQVT